MYMYIYITYQYCSIDNFFVPITCTYTYLINIIGLLYCVHVQCMSLINYYNIDVFCTVYMYISYPHLLYCVHVHVHLLLIHRHLSYCVHVHVQCISLINYYSIDDLCVPLTVHCVYIHCVCTCISLINTKMYFMYTCRHIQCTLTSVALR